MVSTSTSTFFGRVFTATALRAGKSPLNCCPSTRPKIIHGILRFSIRPDRLLSGKLLPAHIGIVVGVGAVGIGEVICCRIATAVIHDAAVECVFISLSKERNHFLYRQKTERNRSDQIQCKGTKILLLSETFPASKEFRATPHNESGGVDHL